MKTCYVDRSFSSSSITLIDEANAILDEYSRQGYTLSLRQLYYQLVSRDKVENTLQSYKRVGSIISDARLAGLVDWEMIEDRGRTLTILGFWDNPAQIVQACASQFRIDKWADQPNHIEVMVEKDALSGVFAPVCHKLEVGFTANKGYSSSSAMYEAGRRMKYHLLRGKTPVVFYFGDHDPSGIDMTRDVTERLGLFAEAQVEVRRLALNYDQVEELNPPENPTKETDSRAQGYIELYGYSSWELDAVEPASLAEMIENAVLPFRDDGLWLDAVDREDEMRNQLAKLVKKLECGK